MDAQVIGRYRVGDDELVLRVPDDEASRAKVAAVMERIATAESSEMGLRFFAVALSVLTGRSVEEAWTMIPLSTIAVMWADIEKWLDHLRPVRPC